MIASATAHMPCEKLTQLQHSKKFVEEVSAAEVREAPMIIGDSHVCW
jgi:hypothetical protein